MTGIAYFDPMQGPLLLGEHPVRKFNPHHGEDGKFAPASSATINAGSSKDPKDKAINAASVAEGNKPRPDMVDSIAKHLSAQGFKETSAGSDKSGNRYFTMSTTQDKVNVTHHSVVVSPNGHWEHTSEGAHSGDTMEELQAMKFGD